MVGGGYGGCGGWRNEHLMRRICEEEEEVGLTSLWSW